MNSLPTPRKLSAILHADAAGFSRLMEADEEQTHRRLNTALRMLITTIEAHSGRVIKTAGDAVLAEFPSVVEAVRSGLSVPSVPLLKRTGKFSYDQRLTFRIGVNLGDVIVDGDDIFGDGVNIAARLGGAGEPRRHLHLRNGFRSALGELDVGFADLWRTEGEEHRAPPSASIDCSLSPRSRPATGYSLDALPLADHRRDFVRCW